MFKIRGLIQVIASVFYGIRFLIYAITIITTLAFLLTFNRNSRGALIVLLVIAVFFILIGIKLTIDILALVSIWKSKSRRCPIIWLCVLTVLFVLQLTIVGLSIRNTITNNINDLTWAHSLAGIYFVLEMVPIALFAALLALDDQQTRRRKQQQRAAAEGHSTTTNADETEDGDQVMLAEQKRKQFKIEENDEVNANSVNGQRLIHV